MKWTSYKTEKIADLPFYTEGPAVDSREDFYCTTLTGGSIVQWTKEHTIKHWASSAAPNGQIIAGNGDHLVCDVRHRSINRYNAAGELVQTEIAGTCAGVAVCCPNDLIMDGAGNLYFTDSVRGSGKVFFKGTNGAQAILADNLDYPNGLVFSPDEKILYVAESYRNRIVKIDMDRPGFTAAGIKDFVRLPCHPSGKAEDNLPDGLALDPEGNIWVAHYGMQAVHRFSPGGELLTSIDTTIPLTSNLVFADVRTVFVTGGYGEPGPGAIVKITLQP
ncbi:SMP-30/gluconolactonase/LRE family protein [Niabella aurantiaca]|uniref:SMP-30/gluconolactonase/LRE family protein n=1 Tax=Niabella aurantiaca TaxID=379900 RepID=UPI00036E1BB3|nr:SMP-30/gluconolactonase/LRE family protein [Niabella aurantiaca]